MLNERIPKGRSIGLLALMLAACGGQSVALSPADAAADGAGPAKPDASDASAPGSGSDATADSGGIEGSAPWTPAALGPKLAFWFDPTSIVAVSGLVPKWSDLSAHGNDATQPTVGYQPTYTTGGIGGLPSVTLDGAITFLSIADSPTLQWGTSDFAVFAVVRATAKTTAAFAMVYQRSTIDPPYDGLGIYLNADKPVTSTLVAAQISEDVYALSTPPPATFTDSTVHLLGARRSGATLEMRVDGAVSGTLMSAAVATTDVSAPGVPSIIGQNGYAPAPEFQQVHGDIAELIGVGETLGAADVANVESYLKARYGIP